MDDAFEAAHARVLEELRDDTGSEIIRIGLLPIEILALWSETRTLEVIVTRERRQHYLERHPEVLRDEPLLLKTVAAPSEVHRNKLDEQIAIFYTEIGDGFYLRVPVWISDRVDRQNSVLSLRRARAREVEAGRAAGRQVWRRMR
jgi:hypothetical protein